MEEAKRMALSTVDSNPEEAWTIMIGECAKHEELKGHEGLVLGTMLLLQGSIRSPGDMRSFIEGFN